MSEGGGDVWANFAHRTALTAARICFLSRPRLTTDRQTQRRLSLSLSLYSDPSASQLFANFEILPHHTSASSTLFLRPFCHNSSI